MNIKKKQNIRESLKLFIFFVLVNIIIYCNVLNIFEFTQQLLFRYERIIKVSAGIALLLAVINLIYTLIAHRDKNKKGKK